LLKGIQEAERIQAAREAEVSKLREELRTLEATDVTDEVGLDGVALRLKICKDLGFDVITNKATGESRMIALKATRFIPFHSMTIRTNSNTPTTFGS